MRKTYNLLLLVVMFMTGICTAQAEKRYVVTGGSLTDGGALEAGYLDEGVSFVLQSGAFDTGTVPTPDFVKGITKTTIITDENLLQIVLDGEQEDGEPVWLLKQVSTGLYLENKTGVISYTATKARAWRFTLKNAVGYTSEQMDADPTEVEDWTCATLRTPNEQCGSGVILCGADQTYETATRTNLTFLLNGALGGNPTLGNNYNQNLWYAYYVEEMPASTYIRNVLDEIVPADGLDNLYNVGDEPGQISQALYDEMLAAYANALEVANSAEVTYEMADAAIDRLKAAIRAAQDGAVKVKNGYYYFRSARTELNATYDNGTQLCWTYNSTWELPEVITAADTKYIWKMTENPERPGSYFIQNVYTGRYVGAAERVGQYIPSTEEAEESYLIYPQNKDYFVIENPRLVENPIAGWAADGYPDCTALHTMKDGIGVVTWTTTAAASGWQFLHVEESDLEAVLADIEQVKLNTELKKAYDAAKADYDAGFAYTSDASHGDPYFDLPGLIDAGSQYWSNCQDPSEGSTDALLDFNDPTSFFHSSWRADQTFTGKYHYLGADLNRAVSAIEFKTIKRINPGDGYNAAPQYPVKLEVYACNDISEGPDAAAWVRQGYITTNYVDSLVYNAGGTDRTYQNIVGYGSIAFDQPYRYVRFDVLSTGNNAAKVSGAPFFCMSAFQIYEATYVPSESLIEEVDATVRARFEAALAAANAAIVANAATREIIDELNAAHELFVENYPHPAEALAILNEAKAQAENAAVGTEPGYFPQEAIDALNAVIAENESKVKDIMTLAEINEVKAALNQALAAFAQAVVKPADGKFYYLVSQTAPAADDATDAAIEANPNGSYVYAAGNGVGMKWMHPSDDVTYRPYAIWKFIHNEDGTFLLKNVMTGEYLNNPKDFTRSVIGSTAADTCAFTLRSAKVPGVFNVVFDEGVYLNAEPGSKNVVTWGVANGSDNSAFKFEEVDMDNAYEGAILWKVNPSKFSIVTLPVDIQVREGNAFSIVGRNADNLVLSPIDGVIVGGTPFFFKEEYGESEYSFETVETTVEGLANNTTTEALEVNNLVGTLAPISELNVGFGILYQGTTIVDSKAHEGVANNSGYIDINVPETEETSEVVIPIDGKIDAVTNVVLEKNGDSAVYTLSGVKVRSHARTASDLNGLPAGIYLIGGKKVFVP
ncbi:MAG: hypothetical protein ACI3YC_05435 [Alloprevotella sp.]